MHLSRLFQRTVRQHPDRPALARGTGPALSYARLDQRVRALAHWLRHDLGLQPGERVVLAMPNCVAYAEAMLALWHARLCAVPVHGQLHAGEVAHVLGDSGAVLCLSFGGARHALVPATTRLPGVALVDVEGQAWCSAAGRTDLPEWNEGLDAPLAADSELAWLFYTSGTTGRPKGVMLSHAHLVAMALAFQADLLPLDEHDVLLHLAPMSHGGGLYGVPAWMRGGLQVVPASGGFDAAEVFALLAHYRRVSLFAAPTMVNRLVRHAAAAADGAEAGGPATTAPGLRCIVAGGAPFYVEDLKAAVARLGPRIAQMYGQGESPMTISALSAAAVGRAVAQGDDTLLGSVGYAMSGIDIDITDTRGGRLATGIAGEIMVRGPTVMRGYWGQPEASAATLIDGALRTGDIGLVDGRGLLHLRDRSKDVIISGGSNIYPREVEEALLRHPRVQEAAAVGMPDAEWGEAVTAFVVTLGTAPLATAELDATCLETLARFKRPKRYVFVEQIPKNATGKVLKNALREQLEGGAGPQPARPC
ncbi:AMP-binding protein [Xylophilus sp. Kf1]|nr:AMP-binding protein [Xylophilus sp. Kf1]